MPFVWLFVCFYVIFVEMAVWHFIGLGDKSVLVIHLSFCDITISTRYAKRELRKVQSTSEAAHHHSNNSMRGPPHVCIKEPILRLPGPPPPTGFVSGRKLWLREGRPDGPTPINDPNICSHNDILIITHRPTTRPNLNPRWGRAWKVGSGQVSDTEAAMRGRGVARWRPLMDGRGGSEVRAGVAPSPRAAEGAGGWTGLLVRSFNI